MHPATATTPFTLLWALEKNGEDPPFMSFAASPLSSAPQSSSAATTTPPSKASPSKPITRATAQPANTRSQGMTSPDRNECAADAFAASDFLVTNLRPDLLD